MSQHGPWEEVWRRFDPEEPAKDPAWRADRPHSPVRRILRKLGLPFAGANTAMLLSGTTGSGKSTELLRVRDARKGNDLVLFLDLLRHFRDIGDADALQRVEAWEVVYQAGIAVLGAAQETLPYPVPPELIDGLTKAWERVADATQTPKVELDLGKIASGMIAAGSVLLPLLDLPAGGATALAVATGVGAAKATADGVRRIVPIGRSQKSLPDQDEAVETLLGAVNLIIGHVQMNARRVVLVIDGLDWIRGEERQLALFDRSELLGRLACPALICAPYTLLSSTRARNLRRFDPFVLANEPVLDRGNLEQDGPGVTFFREVYERRTRDIDGGFLIADELVRELAYFSGGRAREFTKLVREVAERAFSDGLEKATQQLVEEVIADARRECERGLHAGHAEVLRRVREDPARLPESPEALKLIENARLLPFDNDAPWFAPHPLLLKRFLRETGSTG
ncbi:MAG: AAA family ATPase [Polyangiaceae bacterium]